MWNNEGVLGRTDEEDMGRKDKHDMRRETELNKGNKRRHGTAKEEKLGIWEGTMLETW